MVTIIYLIIFLEIVRRFYLKYSQNLLFFLSVLVMMSFYALHWNKIGENYQQWALFCWSGGMVSLLSLFLFEKKQAQGILILGASLLTFFSGRVWPLLWLFSLVLLFVEKSRLPGRYILFMTLIYGGSYYLYKIFPLGGIALSIACLYYLYQFLNYLFLKNMLKKKLL